MHDAIFLRRSRPCHGPRKAGMRKRTMAAALMSALALGLIVGRVPAGAQERAGARESWPSRPVTMVVPFAAGGPVDLLGRIVGQYLAAQLGTPVVIENFPGA